MEFSRLETRQKADEGATLHVRHPFYGHPLYYGPGANADGELVDKAAEHTPVTIAVRGANCATMRKIYKDHERDKMKLGRKLTPSQERQMQEKLGEVVIDATVIGWDGFFDDGAPLPCTSENRRELFERAPDIQRQVIEFSQDQANYMGNASAA
jgi:hypothetical protein